MTEKGNFLREQAAPAREQPFFRGSIGTLVTRAEPDLLKGPTTPRRTAAHLAAPECRAAASEAEVGRIGRAPAGRSGRASRC